MNLRDIQRTIYEHPEAELYKRVWGEVLPTSLAETPILTWEALASCPFLKRVYTDEKLAVHIAYRGGDACLIGRTSESFQHEAYGDTRATRPFVSLEYRHQAIEKSLWFYEHNILPLIALEDPESALVVARAYTIDAMVFDSVRARIFLPKLANFPAVRSVRLLVAGAHDWPEFFEHVDPSILTFVLAPAELGSIATTCPYALAQKQVLFHPTQTAVLEHTGTLIATRTVLLPTPMIRYDTQLKSRSEPTTCSCEGVTETFSLL